MHTKNGAGLHVVKDSWILFFPFNCNFALCNAVDAAILPSVRAPPWKWDAGGEVREFRYKYAAAAINATYI